MVNQIKYIINYSVDADYSLRYATINCSLCLGSICCHSNEDAVSWGHSAAKITSQVFSALKNIGGSFVTVEDGVVSTTTSQKRSFADNDNSELAEDAALKVNCEQLPLEANVVVDSVPVIKLDAADIAPVLVTDENHSQDGLLRQSSSSFCSKCSSAVTVNSLSASSECDHRTSDEPVADMLDDDDNIVFSSGVRRKVRRRKPTKGNQSIFVTFVFLQITGQLVNCR